MSLLCITHSMSEVRKPCMMGGQHLPGCGSTQGKKCSGCVPRVAQQGLLCWPCWEQLVQVMLRWDDFADLVSKYQRLITAESEGGGGSPSSKIPIPQTRIDVDEAESFLTSLRANGSQLDQWVATKFGAQDAIRFIRVAQRAFLSHAIEEKPHRVKTVRCFKCSLPTLWWFPPEAPGSSVEVRCVDEACGFVVDQTSFETIARIEEKKARKVKA